jgi:prolyl-tRNA editing enzyme YbaK/EbsC (Cys-tRNA(Pro) deacylase)
MSAGGAARETEGALGSRQVQRVREALGPGHAVVDLGRSARTAADAARAVGCDVAQIVKSLVFRLGESGRALLVLTSGANRVDEARVAALVGERVSKADADFVRAETGFAIGGVAPVGHARPIVTLIDEDLVRWPEIWAAAGHPTTVVRLAPAELVRLTGGRVVAVK